MNKIIGVDVDGVLANFFTAYEDLVIKIDGQDRFPARYPDALPPVWNWPQHYGYSEAVIAEAWRHIKGSGRFWNALKPLPGAEEFLNALDNLDLEVYFITDRPGLYAQFQTSIWLERMGFPNASVVISRKGKGAACDALSVTHYIDDKGENIENVNENSPGTEAFLLAYPYNKDFQDVPAWRTVSKLEEFLEAISE